MNINLNYIYQELPTRKYKRTNLLTNKSEIVTVTNKNNLSVQQHLKLLNLNDPNHIYSEITNQDIWLTGVFLFAYIRQIIYFTSVD